MKKKVGIITFHNSYNCGSMLESYAIQTYLIKRNIDAEIINFSNEGQRRLYSVFDKNSSLKKVIKNFIVFFHKKKLYFNNYRYEKFKNSNFILSKEYFISSEIKDNYSVVVAGSDQIWNITIPDSDDAYFLNWVKNARKVAYAPSFGARNIKKISNNCSKYVNYLNDFNALSIRENNGKKWLKELVNKDVDVLVDPTLLLDKKDYDKLIDEEFLHPKEYIFFYSPSFDRKVCSLVKKLSLKYNLPVITWSAKKYYLYFIKRFGFKLAEYEDPGVYLNLIKNANLVVTTSFHGTIFSTIYKKKFFVIKNGDMFGDDDRVLTLLKSLKMTNRLISYDFDNNFDYLQEVDYNDYDNTLPILRNKAQKYIKINVEDYYNETIK